MPAGFGLMQGPIREMRTLARGRLWTADTAQPPGQRDHARDAVPGPDRRRDDQHVAVHDGARLIAALRTRFRDYAQMAIDWLWSTTRLRLPISSRARAARARSASVLARHAAVAERTGDPEELAALNRMEELMRSFRVRVFDPQIAAREHFRIAPCRCWTCSAERGRGVTQVVTGGEAARTRVARREGRRGPAAPASRAWP
jgi:hypothetical protein